MRYASKRKRLTSRHEGTGVRVFVLGLERGAVPAVRTELVLALVHGDLHALDGGGGYVRVAAAQMVLRSRQVWVRLTHRVRV